MKRRWLLFLGSVILLGLLLSCGDKVDRNIEQLEKGGKERDQAIMELTLAKQYAIPPLIEALNDPARPVEVRADVAEILFKMYVRESDVRIMPALLEHMDDESAVVRAAIVTSLTQIGKTEALDPLLGRLEVEKDEKVLREILAAIQILDRWEQDFIPNRAGFRIRGGESMSEEQKAQFVERLKVLREQASDPELRDAAVEFLEEVAHQFVEEADRAVLEANLSGAEAKYMEAKALVPNSKNVNQRLGKFYFDNLSREQGLEILREQGMVADIPRLTKIPAIDGDLNDPAWNDAAKLEGFYQNIRLMRAVPAEGNSEVYLGYTDTDIYVGVKGYEESTADLTARFKARDENVWQDDCAEVFFDLNLDYTTFYQIVVNSLGTIADYSYNAKQNYTGGQPAEWNSTAEVGTKVEEAFWTLEMRVPMKDLGVSGVKRGDIWGFNVARVRVAHKGEYDQWVPTYGQSLRPDRFGFLVFK